MLRARTGDALVRSRSMGCASAAAKPGISGQPLMATNKKPPAPAHISATIATSPTARNLRVFPVLPNRREFSIAAIPPMPAAVSHIKTPRRLDPVAALARGVDARPGDTRYGSDPTGVEIRGSLDAG